MFQLWAPKQALGRRQFLGMAEMASIGHHAETEAGEERQMSLDYEGMRITSIGKQGNTGAQHTVGCASNGTHFCPETAIQNQV